MYHPIRDLLDSLAAGLPESGDSVLRARCETHALLLALFTPAQGEADSALRRRIDRALDAVMAERMARSGACA
jgi:hypothetical protein